MHKNDSKLSHFRLVEHKHTGKLIHHRHTSHLALAIILAFLGVFMYVDNTVKAEIVPVSGSVSIGMLVTGPPPAVGATITSPKDGQKIVNKDVFDISGTCQASTFVVVKNNGINAGSTICSADGKFTVQIELYVGTNVISAMNYDNYNQAGPVTPSVTVYVTKKDKNTDNAGTDTPVVPNIPDVPSIVPGADNQLDSCNDFQAKGEYPVGGEPHIAIVCMPRLFLPGQMQTLGLIVWGGVPPYALLIDWGDDSEDLLLSVAKPGYQTVSFGYIVPNTYKIISTIKDANGETSSYRSSVQVSGQVELPAATVKQDEVAAWFKSPVPVYAVAVAITAGFWIGDLFDKRFGSSFKHGKTKTSK